MNEKGDKKKSIVKTKSFDELVDDMNIESLPEDDRERILAKLEEVVLKRVFVGIMEKIGESGRREYEGFVSRGAGNAEIMEFFSAKIRNMDDFVDSVIMELREEMVKGF